MRKYITTWDLMWLRVKVILCRWYGHREETGPLGLVYCGRCLVNIRPGNSVYRGTVTYEQGLSQRRNVIDGKCKNHENMRRMMSPTSVEDYGLGFKIKRDGSCGECGKDMEREFGCLGETFDRVVWNKIVDNATIANPKR